MLSLSNTYVKSLEVNADVETAREPELEAEPEDVPEGLQLTLKLEQLGRCCLRRSKEGWLLEMESARGED